MEVRRINPEDGFLRDFTEYRDRVKSLETKPLGNIVVRETLITEDPSTGVKTVIGQLPDGSYGFQPFVGDITPPPVASAPVVSAEPGIYTVSWDGKFVANASTPNDFTHLTVVGHKLDGPTGSTVTSVQVGVIRLNTETVFVATDVAAVNEYWQFSFESVDYNGNTSARSARSAALQMKDMPDSVGQSLDALQAEVDTAKTNAADAQTAAADAQTKAQEALDAASNASGATGGAVIQDAEPDASQRLPGVLWIDTTNGNNTPKRWNGTAWVAITDKAAIDAAQAAVAAQTRADQAFNNATSAATAAGNAQTSADSKGRIWYQATAPAGTGHKVGDTWFDTANGYRISTWDGSKWQTTQDSALAQQTADSKGRTYTQAVAPPVSARLPQNLWIDTSAGVNLSVTKYWDGSNWTPVKDQEINAAELRAAQDAKNKADAAASAAINAQAYSMNASFDDWTGVLPAFHTLYGTGNPSKETAIVQRGAYAVRFNCTDTTTDRGLNWASGLLSHAPNLEYFTVEVSFYLASGASLSGAGVLLDWLGMTNNRATLSLAAEVPTPVTGKWYNVSKTLRRPTNATGTWTGMDGYLMANYSATDLGSKAVKDIIFDWLNIRPATAGEILAYNAPTTQYVDQAEADAITAAAQDATTKANQAKTDAINDTTTRLVGKNKVIWSTSAASGTGYTAGDTWFQRDASGAVIAQWEFTTSWQSRKVSESVLGNLSAGKITSGVLDAGLIGANTITSDKIFVGDFTNLAADGAFTDTAKKNWTGSGTVINVANEPNRLQVLTQASGNADQKNTNEFQVTAGEQIYGEIAVYGDPANVGGGTANLHLRVFMNDGTTQYPIFASVTRAAALGVWTTLKGVVTIPANAKSAIVEPSVTAAADGVGNKYLFRLANVRRMATGSLIVDGAIDGKTITGPTIQTEATANRGIKLTTTEFAGYDTSGNKNFSLTTAGTLSLKGSLQSGSTIAGATITGALETTAAANRGVKLSNTGINAYDASGNLTFTVDAATGEVQAPGLKANSITGDMIAAGTVTADKMLISRGANLFTDPLIRDSAGWASPYFSSTGGKNGGGSIVIPMNSSQSGTYYAQAANLTSRRTRLVPGSTYRISGWVKTSAAAPSGTVQLYLRYQSEDSTTGGIASNVATEIPNNTDPTVADTWTFVTGMVTVPLSTTYTTGVLGVYKQGGYTTGTTTWSDLSIQEATGGELIVDGAITTNHMTSGTIDAGVLTAGSITAPKIAAKGITVDKLVISSTDNLIVGADMAVSAASWQKTANITYQATAGRGSTPALRFTGVTTTLTSMNQSNRITVEPDNRFRCSIFVKSSAALAAGAVKLVLRCYTTATAYTDVAAISSAALVANTWTQVSGISPTLPAGTLTIEFYVSVTNNATGTTTDIDYVSATRAADGNLVLDGAMDAKSITGATIQTASSGARVVLDTLGLRAWNDAGTQYLTADSTGLSVVGTLSASTVVDANTTVDMVVGGGAGRKAINTQQLPPPSPLGGIPIPGMIFKPKSTVMYDYAGIMADDGITVRIQSGMVQANVTASNYIPSALYLNDTNAELTRPMKAPGVRARDYYFTDGTYGNPDVAGPFKNGRYAEFYNSNFYQEGNQTLWDIGVLTPDTAKTFNNDFVQVTSPNGSLLITKSGYYSISCIQIPNNSMGNGWIRIFNNSTSEIIMAMANTGWQWEQSVVTPCVYLKANESIRFQTYVTTARTTASRVRIQRLFA